MNREYFAYASNWDAFVLKIYIGYREGKDIYVAIGDDFVKVKDKYNPPASLVVYKDLAEDSKALSMLVDSLIRLGARPTEDFLDKSERKALEYHLEDMRKLVFKEDRDGKSKEK